MRAASSMFDVKATRDWFERLWEAWKEDIHGETVPLKLQVLAFILICTLLLKFETKWN